MLMSGKATVPIAASQDAPNVPGIFVDSVSGSDSNAGTSNAPFATLAKVAVTIGTSATTNIYLKRGSIFRETFQIPTNITIDAYGSNTVAPWGVYGAATNSKPIISGAMQLTNANFTALAGKTNTYQITLPYWFEDTAYAPAHSNILAVWDNETRLVGWNVAASSTYLFDTNTLDGTNGTYYFNPTNRVLYIHTYDNTDPSTNGRIYEASVRTLVLHGGDNVSVNNVITDKGYAYNSGGGQGYGVFAQGSGVFRRCVFRNGWNHLAGPANSVISSPLTFDSCTAENCQQGTLFIAYKDNTNTVSEVVFTNCLARQNTQNSGIATGFYGHDLGTVNPGVRVKYINCIAYNLAAGFSDFGAGRLATNVGNTAVYCTSGTDIGDSKSVVRFTNYWSPAASSGKGVTLTSASGTNGIIDCKFIFTNNATGVYAPANTSPRITNCIFAAHPTNGRIGYHLKSTVNTVYWYAWSNVFANSPYVYQAGTFTNGSAGYNTYYTNNYIASMAGGAPGAGTYLQSQFVTWTNTWWTNGGYTVDITSTATTAGPGYADAFYTYTVTDPTGGDAN